MDRQCAFVVVLASRPGQPGPAKQAVAVVPEVAAVEDPVVAGGPGLPRRSPANRAGKRRPGEVAAAGLAQRPITEFSWLTPQ